MRSGVSRGNEYVRAGHIATEQGGVARWQGSNGGGKVKWSDDGVKGVAVHDGNLYAGKDGNVYRRDADGGWDKYGGGGDWENVTRPNNPNNPGNPNNPNRPNAGDRPNTGNNPGRPTTLPADIERRPATRPAQTPTAPDTMDRLNREAQSRDRGLTESSRQQNFQRSTQPAANTRQAPSARSSYSPAASASSRTHSPSGSPRAGTGRSAPSGGGRSGGGGRRR